MKIIVKKQKIFVLKNISFERSKNSGYIYTPQSTYLSYFKHQNPFIFKLETNA